MLRLLARRLRAHSLGDRHPVMSTRDEVDSPADTTCSTSSQSDSASPSADSPYFMMTGTDLQYDQHSSEEELEVINNTPKETFRKYDVGASGRPGRGAGRGGRALRPASAAPPEKRKWAAAQCPDPDRLASPFGAGLSVRENDENTAANSSGVGGPSAATASALDASSEDEAGGPAPVRFRTEPPLDALPLRRRAGPGGGGGRGGGLPLAPRCRACSCCRAEPRKRSRHSARRAPAQRPCLDFDKMQQLKVHTVTAWRHGGSEHGGELSVFCW